jgi:DNA primase
MVASHENIKRAILVQVCQGCTVTGIDAQALTIRGVSTAAVVKPYLVRLTIQNGRPTIGDEGIQVVIRVQVSQSHSLAQGIAQALPTVAEESMSII